MLLAGDLLGIAAATLSPHPVGAAEWPAAYIRALPDEAFAVVEGTPEGVRLRRLPHHDHAGALDLPHLRSALARWHQVRWRDPAAAAAAREHLEEHSARLRAARRLRGAGGTD
jgi:hypothetical protein